MCELTGSDVTAKRKSISIGSITADQWEDAHSEEHQEIEYLREHGKKR